MKDTEQLPAFVLRLEVNSYGIIRSLAREGVRIVGFYDGKAEDFGRFSRYVQAHFLDAALSDEQVCAALIDCASHFSDKPVLFVADDRHALLLATYRRELSQHFAFHWWCAEGFSKVVDKSEMSRLCDQAGVLCPLTHITQPVENLARRAQDFPFPCLVKPKRSFGTAFPFGTKNFVAESPQSLLDFYQRNPGLIGQTIWQELIEGKDDEILQCTVLIRQSGEIGALFGIRKIRQFPPGYGSMCFGRSEENEIVASLTLKLLRFLNYRGFASLEFKHRPKDNRYYFIEMNPRLPWYNALFADAGINLPYLAYLDLTQKREPATLKLQQRSGVYWISFRDDLASFLRRRRERRESFWQWIKSVVKARSFAWWSWSDPLPFLRATTSLLVQVAQKIRSLASRPHQPFTQG